jgi:hypothetical protein
MRGQATIVPKYNTFLATNPTKLRPFDGLYQAQASRSFPAAAASNTSPVFFTGEAADRTAVGG